MHRVTALIAEDEAVLRDDLRAQLAALWPELAIAALASNGIEALQMVERHQPDIAFLDIEMPGLTGLEVARQCEGRCHAQDSRSLRNRSSVSPLLCTTGVIKTAP